MTIRLLSENVAARIAAGEVVERPASVIKELVENSLDAGAMRVEVASRGGGRDLMRVRDNGHGIATDEIELAFRRHATSKLQTAADLENIATLGFRGEALASIASVSRVTCITRHRDSAMGTRLQLAGGQVVAHSPIGRPQGTEILIEDLFFNVPARRKFLRSERTERRHIDAFLTRYAIAYPHIAFSVMHAGREALATSGNGAADEALTNVYGIDLGSHLLAIPPELTQERSVQVRGFVGPTTIHRANRGYITLFINGRWVQDLRLTYAIIQAYHTLLPVKRFPVAFVMVTIPAADVDVNVHPAKTEVRFRDADAAFRAIQRAVRSTVLEQAPTTAAWQVEFESPSSPAATPSDTRAQLAALTPASQITLPESPTRSTPQPRLSATTPPATSQTRGSTLTVSAPPKLPPLRIIGQASTMFIIAEGPDGLYLIDQHAAHERVLYEQMLSQWTQGQVSAQPLLEPQTVSLPLDAAGRLEGMLAQLHTLGLDVEAFGPGTFLVRAVPAILSHVAVDDLLADIAMSRPERSPIREELEAAIIRRICKRIAVKAGQVLSPEEMARLIQDLEQTQNPRTCPHGRPTIIQISLEQLTRQFGRMGY